MRKSTLLKVATQSILKNKMRTFLTMLGIVIGVAAVIVMVAVGYGAQTSIQKQIGALGTNMIMIMPGASSAGGVNQGAATFNRLTPADYEKLQRESLLLSAVSPVVFTQAQAISGQGNWRTRIRACPPSISRFATGRVEQGTFFTEADRAARARWRVLGTTVAKNLFPDGDARRAADADPRCAVHRAGRAEVERARTPAARMRTTSFSCRTPPRRRA